MRQPATDHRIVIVGADYAGLHVALRSSADGRTAWFPGRAEKVNAHARRSRPHRPSRSDGLCAQPRISGRAARAAQWRAIDNPDRRRRTPSGRLRLENEQGTPIYVDAKAVVWTTSGRWAARSIVAAPAGTLPAADKEGKKA
jgi:hypothetical protein